MKKKSLILRLFAYYQNITKFFILVGMLLSSVIMFGQELQQPNITSERTDFKILKGRIYDEKGEGLIGAAIVVKDNTSVGTITNNLGEFTLKIPISSKVLIVSYIGYSSREIEITNQNTYNIILKEISTDLGEVVVVGYGAQKKNL